MKHFRMGHWAAAGVGFLAVTAGFALGCGSDGASDPPKDQEQTQDTVGPEDRERIEMGLTLSPVAVNLAGLDRDMVGLGSYIVNAQGACNDCHTNPPYAAGGNPFMGQPEQINAPHFLAGGMTFPGGVVSANITPDAQGMPAGLSFEAFLNLMRTGREPNGGILQVMPWPVYGKMRDADLRAVYEYLRSIPAAQPGTTPTP
ncbi:cytochrome C [Pyxidicoccus parkwayensis]|uniref:Cytochrome C n=1 Tax=Pyxidicoccus parkwayensis TaxID=2813578 RepID=A0ABX7NLH9_9BACT|nr:cytochrome C [Pyxidicoccus parkwaysis]QSQ19707.1 cytochrome C [Pyxidicoccus parkwaysis]